MNLESSVGLRFNGDCEAALKSYERLLGGKLEIVLTWGGSPLAGDAPPEWRDKILFARLRRPGMTLLGADALPGTYRPLAGFNLNLSTNDAAEAERVFAELANGGTVHMALQQTFWAERYGEVVDRFGVPWEVRTR